MIYNSLIEIIDKFDLFLFDAYGVFWEGNGFYRNSREIMAELLNQGKTVVVISNTTNLQEDIKKSYAQKGLFEGQEYNYFFTSGDLLRHNLVNENISFQSCQQPTKYYVIGKSHDKAFADTKYVQVESPQKADFVYCGVPFLTSDDVQKYPQYQNQYWPVSQNADGNIYSWDTLTAAPFYDIIQRVAELKLPILNANPDFTAKEGHPLVSNSEAVFVIRNGTIAELLRQAGNEVIEYGKPHKNIYDYVFNQLQKQGITINKRRTCMIGDTVRTDVKGGINAGIVSVLCVNTGVCAEEIAKGKTLENLCNAENIDLKQVIQIGSVGGF